MKDFSIASGTIIGKEHVDEGKNNKDGLFAISTPEYIIGFVCDGCSSGLHSEVGAKLGAKLLADQAVKHSMLFQSQCEAAVLLQIFRQKVLGTLESICNLMGKTPDEQGRPSTSKTVDNYMLFTALGFVITPSRTIVFSIGDGVVALNGETKLLEPGENNTPAYLAYGIVQTTVETSLDFVVHWDVPTESVSSILIGSDGVKDIVKAANAMVPGKQEQVGPLNQFWDNEFFFRNRDGIRRRLNMLNRSVPKLEEGIKTGLEPAILRDDTTLIVVRRKQ